MLLAFVICTTFAVIIANPLHKYPYVFLLDVGNEELQKTNTEQLRISIPGGSLSMKYPALGEGDPITHVRVSGIDFGTDLKVNIVGGGPGFRYVVLMFMGNPGVTYDAVVTLQTLKTLPSEEESIVNENKIPNSENITPNSYEVSDAECEDNDQDIVKDSNNMKQYSKKSKEVTQASSTYYNYAKSQLADGNADGESQNVSSEEQDDNDETEEEEDEEESDFANDGESAKSNEEEPETSKQEERASDVSEQENESGDSAKPKLYFGQDYSRINDIPRAEQYTSNIDLNDSDNDKPVDIVDDNLYDKYQALKPHFGVGFRVYPQSFFYSKPYQMNSAYNKEDPVELDQMFNDEEVHNDARFKDGSNSIDSDYAVAEY